MCFKEGRDTVKCVHNRIEGRSGHDRVLRHAGGVFRKNAIQPRVFRKGRA
jgi:hypothetical protein